MSELQSLGWSASFEADLALTELTPARVLGEQRGAYEVESTSGVRRARVAGRLRHHATGPEDLPAVGDWVGIEDSPPPQLTTIHRVLPRRSWVLRKVAGPVTRAQVLAANVEWGFIVTSLNREFRPRRIERYLAVLRDGGVDPVVLLNKADLCPDPSPPYQAACRVARDVPVHLVSGLRGDGMADLESYLGPGQTAVLLGMSGVGKSTLTNRLLGRDEQLVREIRADDDRGRHTTTSRQLLRLPGGGMLIDTPGLREVALWGDGDGVEASFDDIEALAAACRFRDCRHQGEPGCALEEAVATGRLEAGRLASFQKLQKELAHLARRQDQAAREAERRRWKQITVGQRRRRREEDR